MDITRKEFVKMAAGAAGCAALSTPLACAAAKSGKPKHGVSLYSYTGDLGITMTVEDCLADMNDMNAEGLEVLANTHLRGVSARLPLAS